MRRAETWTGAAASYQRPSLLARAFDPSRLQSHYVLARGAPAAPDHWSRQQFAGWTLAAAPDLPILRLEDGLGATIGWLVGHPVDLEAGVILQEAVRLRCDLGRHDVEAALDEDLHRFGGRWVAIVLGPLQLVFPDGLGALTVMAAPHLDAVTSSPFLLGDPLPPDSRFVDVFRAYESGATFALGTTPLEGVELVPPNHVLDLRTFEIRRCWPNAPVELLPLDVAVERIGSSFEATIAAAVAWGSAHVGLTAGGDTRLIAACARGSLDDLDFFTVPFRDASGITDARWAPQVAARFGLRHRILPWVVPTDADVQLAMYRMGCLTGEKRGRLAAPSYAQLGGKGLYVSGVNGCAARGADWRSRDRHDVPIPVADLPRVLGARADPELVRRAEQWLEALPSVHTLDMLTLLVLEMHDSVWAGALASAYPDAASGVLYPYGSRTVIDAILRTSWADRRSDRLRIGVIASRWPELLELPLNRMTRRQVIERRGRRYLRLAWPATRAAWRRSNRLIRSVRTR